MLYSKEQDPVIDYLYDEGLLYVLIGKAYRNVNQTIYVDNDNVLAGREAADYLFGLGHRRIAYLSGDHSLLFNKDRKSGYLLSLAEHQVPFRPDLCIEAPEVPEERNLALEKTCAELGISIPGDLSIISFNNSLFARLTYPPLTSMDINSFQLGIEAASQMISHIETPDLMATKTIVPHHIVARESCKAVIGETCV